MVLLWLSMCFVVRVAADGGDGVVIVDVAHVCGVVVGCVDRLMLLLVLMLLLFSVAIAAHADVVVYAVVSCDVADCAVAVVDAVGGHVVEVIDDADYVVAFVAIVNDKSYVIGNYPVGHIRISLFSGVSEHGETRCLF